MATSKSSGTTSTSTCTLETARGKHVFNIAGYSLHEGLGAGEFVRSTPFAVGGYDWCIMYYPDEDGGEDTVGYVSVYLELLTDNTEVRAGYQFGIINQVSGLALTVLSKLTPPTIFNTFNANGNNLVTEDSCWGTNQFKKRRELKASPYLQDDTLSIECEVIVFNPPRVEETTPIEIPAPPSDLSDHFGKLMETQEESDVNFRVKGEVFPAHKIVLAVRSPVFKAELYGPMREKSRRYVTVEDMQPAVFKALLHFIYTDSLPSMNDLDDDENKEMVKHLLVAADRYAMERMKKICEGILCKNLNVETVTTTLALADQHHCSRLKDACIQFITSSNRMDDVVASQGYVHLKRSCPTVLVDTPSVP